MHGVKIQEASNGTFLWMRPLIYLYVRALNMTQACAPQNAVFFSNIP